MTEESNINLIWKKNTELVRDFLQNREDYEQLCSEVAYILKKKLTEQQIQHSAVTHRAKTLNSFLEKITRKSYSDPLKEITDLAGARIVFLYQDDLEKIENIIRKEFSDIKKVDKINEKGADKFGYNAMHFVVKLGKSSFGARYDDLKNLNCEIQVRTVLQDAWAIIDHHLIYKKESDIPTKLQRKINGLAGLFETADNQFESIRRERDAYLVKVNKSKDSGNFLKNELNLDTFISYLSWKFPEYRLKFFENQHEIIYRDIIKYKQKTLQDIDNVVKKYNSAIPTIKDKLEQEYRESYYKGEDIPSSLLVATILDIEFNGTMKANLPMHVKEFIRDNLKKEDLLNIK